MDVKTITMQLQVNIQVYSTKMQACGVEFQERRIQVFKVKDGQRQGPMGGLSLA